MLTLFTPDIIPGVPRPEYLMQERGNGCEVRVYLRKSGGNLARDRKIYDDISTRRLHASTFISVLYNTVHLCTAAWLQFVAKIEYTTT